MLHFLRTYKIQLFLAAFVLVVVAVGMARIVSPVQKITIHENVVYCTGGNHNLFLDVVEPAVKEKRRPAILFVHGGGWQGGSKLDYRDLMMGLAEKGAVGFSIDYRLASEAKYPAQVEDAKCAVRFMRAHATEYAIEPKNIIAIGGSAGAYLVAMLGTTADHPELEGSGGYAGESSRIAAMVLHAGVYDLSQAFSDSTINPGSRQNVFALLGANTGDDPEKYAYANPIGYVSGTSAHTLLIHGDKDPLVPATQAVQMHEALKHTGAISTLVIIKNGGHMDFGQGDEQQRVTQAFLGFLADNLPE